MADTPNLGLTYIEAAQAQKHVTHNEALKRLDAVVQLAVLDRTASAPPAVAAEGERHIVGAGASGAWAGKSGAIAAFQDGAWIFYAPREGWLVWVAAENQALVWHAAAWQALPAGNVSLQNVPLVGVNAQADATNKLAVAADASLFNNAGHGHRLKINKASAGDTASVLLQDGFSGRAEIGLSGDDNLHVKVSADGASWKESISIDRASGIVSFPSGANGLQGPAGPQGPKGDTGAVGAQGPAGANGAPGAQGPQGATGLPGVNGPPGSQGAIGPQGPPGVSGSGGAGSAANLLINGDFQINQRAFAGGALVAGAYGFDRWKGDAGGANLTLSGLNVALTSGTIVQPVEPAVWGAVNFAAAQITVSVQSLTGGNLTVAAGSATGVIAAGAGVRSVTLTTAAGDTGNLAIKLGVAAGAPVFGQVKAELAAAATPWLSRGNVAEQDLCERYHVRLTFPRQYFPIAMMEAYAANGVWGPVHDFRVPMRAVPSVAMSARSDFGVYNTAGSAVLPLTGGAIDAALPLGIAIWSGCTIGSNAFTPGQATFLVNTSGAAFIDCDAEI